MADQKPITQLTLFPARTTLKEVMQEGISQLPITNTNELIALLHLHQNTLLNLTKENAEIQHGKS